MHSTELSLKSPQYPPLDVEVRFFMVEVSNIKARSRSQVSKCFNYPLQTDTCVLGEDLVQ